MISRNSSYKPEIKNIIANYQTLKNDIACLQERLNNINPELLIASKYFDKELLDKFITQTKHKLFGENIIQDAQLKWQYLKNRHPYVKLHFIGQLQSNKIKAAVQLFDTIETISSIKTAMMIKSISYELSTPTPEIYLQINIGAEATKNGISTEDFPEKFQKISQIIPVNGIMCIPPQVKNTNFYFEKMTQIAQKFFIKKISMGMSNDYKNAIEYGSTEIRVGRMLLL